MDILHVVQCYYPAVGGTENQVRRISEELVSQFGDNVTVFTSDRYNAEGFVNPFSPKIKTGTEILNGVQVRRFKVLNQAGPFLKPLQWLAFRLNLPLNQYLRVWYSGPHLSGLTSGIRRFQCDLVMAASFPLLHMFTALHAAQLARLPLVFAGSQHPEDKWGYQRPMIPKAILKANAYIAMTEYEARYVIEQGADARYVFVVGNGVDPKPFLSITKEEARKRLGLSQNFPIVGFIGQLGRHKGVDTLLNAMTLVWRENPEVHLLVAGAQTTFIPHIHSIVDHWPAEMQQKVIFFLNFEDSEKASLFNAVDIFAYPSGFESFGIAFLEAWAAGKPVIGCRRGAVPWVVQDGVDGLLTNYHDKEGLANAIITLLGNTYLAQAYGEAGKRKVLDKFTWPLIACQFREVYAKVALKSV